MVQSICNPCVIMGLYVIGIELFRNGRIKVGGCSYKNYTGSSHLKKARNGFQHFPAVKSLSVAATIMIADKCEIIAEPIVFFFMTSLDTIATV